MTTGTVIAASAAISVISVLILMVNLFLWFVELRFRDQNS